MSWFIFIVILGYFGYNVSRFWVEHEYWGIGILRILLILFFGCFVEAVENLKIIFSGKKPDL